ncbi:hypothetical protein EDB19DRAFT_1968068 [Suillus lakei]|nr:hypothetical protein EDB19DRAFT_1968068 [Suillus lakei]
MTVLNINTQDLKKAVGDEATKVGQGCTFKSGWIVKEGNGFIKAVSNITDTTQTELHKVESLGLLAAGEKVLAKLQKCKFIIQRFFILQSSSHWPITPPLPLHNTQATAQARAKP